ncbi:MAG: Tol-Pal system subunit TolQ, partial [Salinibacterium sp.]|nr:Tol-Pal system subunit TolQ [Salinibacterium sp.]
MTPDLTLVGLISEASLLVKLVMLILLLASVFSWHIIFRKKLMLSRAARAATAFEDTFWSGKDLVSIYNRINAPKYDASAMERIFQ